MLHKNCKKSSRNYNFSTWRMCLYSFTSCEILVFLSFISQYFVLCDEVNNSTMFESDVNYTVYNVSSNDLEENISMSYQNINETDFNKSLLSNLSVDVSTELESTMSVTEDSDNFQSRNNRDLILFHTADEDICNCDLTSNVCDINCCCDPDCSQEDIQVFSECSHQVLTPDENYCYQKDIILRNNTVYKMVKNPNNAMFCIVHDNLKHHLRFKEMPILKSHRDVITVLKYKYKNTYSWDDETENIYDSSEPKAGNPIYIQVTSNQKNINSHWSLPSSCLSDICSCYEEVRYLNNFKSSCTHVIKNLGSECEHNEILSGNKFANFCINPHGTTSIANLVIHTKMVASNSSDDVEYDSSQPSGICAEKKLRKPTKRGNKCENVVKHIHFTVEHDGANGIVGIFVDFQYANVSIDSPTLITQSYTVDFTWSNTTDVERKSGNPGYQIGLPILAATNGSEFSSEEMSKEFYKEGLSVLSGGSGSVCQTEIKNRQMVKFGKSLNTGCFLKHDFSDCNVLRNRISGLLLGPSKQQIYVGIFGNANISNPSDWIEVFNDMEGPTDGSSCLVSLGLKIHIIYAAVGTVANPQYKIVGVRYLHTKQTAIDLTCAPHCRNISLSTSVSFFDVTLSAIEHYAKVPAIKANLPDDFFYPFLYGQSVNNICNVYLILMMLLYAYYFNTDCVIK